MVVVNIVFFLVLFILLLIIILKVQQFGKHEVHSSFYYVQEPLLTCTMRVVCKKNGCVQFTTEYNEKAIKRRILAGKDEEVIELVVAIKQLQKSTSE